MTRQERRQEARKNGKSFEPQYNKGRVITKAEYDKEVLELKKEREEAKDKFLKEKALKELSETSK